VSAGVEQLEAAEDVGAVLRAAFEEAGELQQQRQQQQQQRHVKGQRQQEESAAAAAVTITDWTKRQQPAAGDKQQQQQDPQVPSPLPAAAANGSTVSSGIDAAAAGGGDGSTAAAAECAEERAVGAVRWSVYAAYARAVGIGMSLAVLISLLLMQVSTRELQFKQWMRNKGSKGAQGWHKPCVYICALGLQVRCSWHHWNQLQLCN
jgi:hypothetical protein